MSCNCFGCCIHVILSAQILVGCGFDFVDSMLMVRFLWFVDSVWVFLVGDSALLTAYGLTRGGCVGWIWFCGVLCLLVCVCVD